MTTAVCTAVPKSAMKPTQTATLSRARYMVDVQWRP